MTPEAPVRKNREAKCAVKKVGNAAAVLSARWIVERRPRTIWAKENPAKASEVIAGFSVDGDSLVRE